ncbi:hypothetical protein GGR42_002713 [Saonia flava]|uniref:Uncharacterized protein n=1 Tax=Saonia flava TaxID=523696 RepID=A0A846QZW7_9FLAO|nr:hypothetical protein [Saonia flava]NJB72222.1 hypothetical protein [Saonia flava]
MEIAIFTKEYKTSDSIANFMDFYYSLRMRYLASDFLDKGLSPKQITDGVVQAMRAGRSSGIDLRQHFMPIFSGMNKEIIRDCKLSRLGYALVLMNADARLTEVGKWQLEVLKNYFNK